MWPQRQVSITGGARGVATGAGSVLFYGQETKVCRGQVTIWEQSWPTSADETVGLPPLTVPLLSRPPDTPGTTTPSTDPAAQAVPTCLCQPWNTLSLPCKLPLLRSEPALCSVLPKNSPCTLRPSRSPREASSAPLGRVRCPQVPGAYSITSITALAARAATTSRAHLRPRLRTPSGQGCFLPCLNGVPEPHPALFFVHQGSHCTWWAGSWVEGGRERRADRRKDRCP